MSNRPMLVCTDADLWNAADGSGFFVSKGEAKPLPEYTTPIIDDGLAQGLLREATKEEVDKYEFNKEMEIALHERRFIAGNNYNETVVKFRDYKKSLELIEEPVEESVEALIKEPTVLEPIEPEIEGE